MCTTLFNDKRLTTSRDRLSVWRGQTLSVHPASSDLDVALVVKNTLSRYSLIEGIPNQQ